MAYIEFNDIVKSYQMGEVSIQALILANESVRLRHLKS